MKDAFDQLKIGLAIAIGLGCLVVGINFLSLTIGPSTNTIMSCKGIAYDSGWLKEELNHEWWVKSMPWEDDERNKK